MDGRKNDDLIIYKLDEIHKKIDDNAKRLEDHIIKTEHTIHGNGTIGLKTKVEVLTTRLSVMASGLGVALVAIINDYFNRG